MPFSGPTPTLRFAIAGRPPAGNDADAEAISARYHVVTPGYFSTMRIPMLLGRDFNGRDSAETPWGVVINESMAKLFWSEQNPVGHQLTIDLVPEERPREVIGVIRNVRLSPYEGITEPAMYALFTQQAPRTLGPIASPSRNRMTFVLRVAGDSAGVAAGVRRLMTAMDRDRPLTSVERLDDSVATVTGDYRNVVTLFSLFASVALLLATMGVYGVVSYGVAQRTQEIGVRMALGASIADIRRLVLRDVVITTVMGVAIGLGVAAWLTAEIASFLFGVSQTDPVTYVTVALLMGLTVLAASWIPTRRAIRVPPTVALRAI
jgi:putative ABC transport system permease protein